MKTAQVRDFRGGVDGEKKVAEVKVGDWVGFKCDIEQSGKIIEIKKSDYRGKVFTLENENGFSGEYIGGDIYTTADADDCWIG